MDKATQTTTKTTKTTTTKNTNNNIKKKKPIKHETIKNKTIEKKTTKAERKKPSPKHKGMDPETTASDNKKRTAMLLRSIPLMEMQPLNMSTPEEIMEATRITEKEGFSICKVHDSEQERLAFQKEIITEIWNCIISEQALTPEKAAQVRRIVDDTSFAWYTGDLPKWLKKELHAALGTMIFLHHGFGAPSSQRFFNLICSWKLRGNEKLACFAEHYLGTHDIKYSLDRCIAKFPGAGDEEFLHKDHSKNVAVRTKTHLNGKYCATDSTFICVPKSHLDHEVMFKTYRHLYPNSHGDKWALDPAKEDHLKFFERAVKVKVPAGYMVWW